MNGRMRRARSLLAVTLALLVPAMTACSNRALASQVPLIRPCCCALGTDEPAPRDAEARLERSSPCAISLCCATDAPSAPPVAEAPGRTGLDPAIAAAPAAAGQPAQAPLRFTPRPRSLAPPGHGPPLILQKQSFLL